MKMLFNTNKFLPGLNSPSPFGNVMFAVATALRYKALFLPRTFQSWHHARVLFTVAMAVSNL